MRSPRLAATIGLAQVAREVVESPPPVLLLAPGGPVEATIVDLPFV